MTETHHGYERLMRDFAEQLRESEARPVKRLSNRRRAAAGLALACLVAAALTIVEAGGSGRFDDVVAQAEAALGPAGKIVHLVTTSHTEMRGGSRSEIVGPEAEDGAPRVVERWSTSGPLRWRVLTTVPIVGAHGTSTGQVERSYAEDTEETYIQSLNTLSIKTGVSQASPRLSLSDGPLGADPAGHIRSMLEAGQLHDAGSATVNGRSVRRLVGEEPASPGGVSHLPWPVEYDVDPETFAPIRFTVEEVGESIAGNTGVPTTVVDINSYEELPLNASNSALLSIHPVGNPVVSQVVAGEAEDLNAQSARRAARRKRVRGA